MTVTLSERWAVKVVLDGPPRRTGPATEEPASREELMEPIRADVTPTVLRWSPSDGLPVTGNRVGS
jgi:hypothetical protein